MMQAKFDENQSLTSSQPFNINKTLKTEESANKAAPSMAASKEGSPGKPSLANFNLKIDSKATAQREQYTSLRAAAKNNHKNANKLDKNNSLRDFDQERAVEFRGTRQINRKNLAQFFNKKEH